MGIRRMKPIPKTQKEISKDLQPEPYDTQQGNPNDAQYDPSNRGNQLSFTHHYLFNNQKNFFSF